MLNPSGIITLITDFGEDDYYTGAVKGVILAINPQAKIIDITNNIDPGNLTSASFVLYNSFSQFPRGTVHYCIVDPGVGTQRKPLMVYNQEYYFIAPDNGILGPVLKSTRFNAFDISGLVRNRKDISSTFHGRDIFAPAAARISKGDDIRTSCRKLDEIQLSRFPSAVPGDDGLEGTVLYIDRFGNIITNLRKDDMDKHLNSYIIIKNIKIDNHCRTFQEAPEGEPFFYIGSGKFVEIAYKGDRADMNLDVVVGDKIILTDNE